MYMYMWMYMLKDMYMCVYVHVCVGTSTCTRAALQGSPALLHCRVHAKRYLSKARFVLFPAVVLWLSHTACPTHTDAKQRPLPQQGF